MSHLSSKSISFSIQKRNASNEPFYEIMCLILGPINIMRTLQVSINNAEFFLVSVEKSIKKREKKQQSRKNKQT